jgi:hypothetical protein
MRAAVRAARVDPAQELQAVLKAQSYVAHENRESDMSIFLKNNTKLRPAWQEIADLF